MTVPNRFSMRRRDRDRIVRMGAVAAALAGCGVAALMLVVVGGLIPMGVAYRLGLLAALLGGAVWAIRLANVALWTPGDTAVAMSLGLLWLALGGTASMIIGALPFMVGLLLAAAGTGALILDRQPAAFQPRAA